MRYESGDRAGALNEYLAFADRLRLEMNSAPMPETASLAERVQHGRELAGAGDASAAPASGVAPVLPFVGRGAEIGELLDVWNAAARGRGTFAFVGGETGIGKTRLAAEFAHLVEERGGRVLTGSTSFHEAVPYEAITDALRGALPLVAALKPDVSLASLTSLLPELRARVALPDLPRLAAESERIRLFDAACRAIGQLRARSASCCWCSRTCTGRVRHARHAARSRAPRRGDQSDGADHVSRRRNAAVASAAALTQRCRRHARCDEPVAQASRRIGRRGDLRGAGRGARPFGRRARRRVARQSALLDPAGLGHARGRTETAPVSLETLLERRIERLSSEARTAAEIAACIGDHFSRDALREVSAWTTRP